MRTPAPHRLCVAGFLALLVGACSAASYLSSTYGGVAPQIITTGCRDAYEVYDKQDARRLLVVSHIFREHSDCGGPGRPVLTGDGARRARFSEAAEHYLAELRRADCRVLETNAISTLHYEFVYACSTPAATTRRTTLLPRT